MKKIYHMHWGSYALGENEKLYTDMARKGWMLEKRGAYLSRFGRANPQKMRYRIELSCPSLLGDDQVLPVDQMELYQECGWKYVTRRGLVNVFCAPEDSDTPDLHTDPKQQAATLKGLRRDYLLGWLITAVLIGIMLLLALTGSDHGATFSKYKTDMHLHWVRSTALLLLFATYIVWVLYANLYATLSTMRLHRRLKRGLPLDHSPTKRRRVYRSVSAALAVCCLISGALTIVQLAGSREQSLPLESNDPYVLLEDLGWSGERDAEHIQIPMKNQLQTTHSLVADQWYTVQSLYADGTVIYLYQDIYQMHSAQSASSLAQTLMYDAIFARTPTNFTSISIDGLDEAYLCGNESIAVKGNYVYSIIYLGYGSQANDEMHQLLTVIANLPPV